MGLGQEMESWSFDRMNARQAVALAVVVCALAAPAPAAAQSVPASEREALVRLIVDRGGRAEDADALIDHANAAGAKGLPVMPLTNKIREGIAKGHEPARIEALIRQLTGHLESADRMIRDLPQPPVAAGREASVTLLADAFFSGVTIDEVNEIRRLSQAPGGTPISPDGLAGAAKGLSFIKEARLSATDGAAVMSEAARGGFRSLDMVDLGREIKRRERDFREGRATLRALREAIARGSRPEQLLRERRTRNADRPATPRRDPATRPEPAARPERPRPPDRPDRPERPEATRTR